LGFWCLTYGGGGGGGGVYGFMGGGWEISFGVTCI